MRAQNPTAKRTHYRAQTNATRTKIVSREVRKLELRQAAARKAR